MINLIKITLLVKPSQANYGLLFCNFVFYFPIFVETLQYSSQEAVNWLKTSDSWQYLYFKLLNFKLTLNFTLNCPLFTLNCIFTLSGARQSLLKMMSAQHPESRLLCLRTLRLVNYHVCNGYAYAFMTSLWILSLIF